MFGQGAIFIPLLFMMYGNNAPIYQVLNIYKTGLRDDETKLASRLSVVFQELKTNPKDDSRCKKKVQNNNTPIIED